MFQQPFFAVFLVLRIHGFGDAVGVKEQLVVRSQLRGFDFLRRQICQTD
jgi:hypothetical protein